ncbi:hypothetical protein BVC93_22415 [Mycobacterium sp. MS1601]|uniref:hypothetical protein n=1 Tax=Mycobacterium sp. MS1601 TaxID=1936029 RepID=UPI0009791069|nr:hypothetical protein [Mycobacterium sp. MS1601]AQA04718.1 hypothetical protein BVC93_22415 [Mycobacterium sp. MS1601]
MKKFGIAAATASALTVGLLGLAAPALAAPSGNTNAQATISSLQEQGYDVVVNRLSERPLTEANVVSVGEGASFTHTVSGANHDDDKQFGPVTTTTVYVNVR